jgi:amino acid adenylation domain-containing protein
MTLTHVKKTTGLAPLTSTQKRIWFMEYFDTTTIAYNIPCEYKITGNLEIDTLTRAIDILVERHESLRTVFEKVDGSPVQKILPKLHGNIQVTHLEDIVPESRAGKIAQLSLANSSYKFDLENGPMFRIELLVLGNYQFYLLLNFHHIIFDDVSINIFIEELTSVIESLSQGKPINLAPVAVTFSDYSIAHNKWLKSDECRSQLDYWKKELSGFSDVLQLPVDHPRPKILTYNGKEFRFTIDQDLRNRLLNISLKHNTSLFLTMMTAYGDLLSRYSLQEDLVIGVPVSIRNNTELESLMGVLINTLPIRIRLDGEQSFLQNLEQVSKKFFSAYEHQEVPFEHLVEELAVKPAMDVNPVFQAIFNYLPEYSGEIRQTGLRVQKMDVELNHSEVDLTLEVNDRKNILFCKLRYNTDLFNTDTIERFAGHFLMLLQGICIDDGKAIDEIPILTEKETNQMLIQWNQTQTDYPENSCIHDVIEEQVKKTPDAIALEYNKQQLTYSQMNSRANALARFLLKRGAGEDKIVAIFLERGLDLPVTMLAVSKTGSTYLPIDPIFPKARLETILQDAGPVILVTQSSLLGKMPQNNADLVIIDDPAIFNQEQQDNLGLGNPMKPLYIVYTSGSTGKPKGVPIKQHSLVSLVKYQVREMAVTPEDVLFAVTTVSFDVAEMDLCLPLFAGAKMVVSPQETATNTELLMKALEETGATLFEATPVTYKMLIRSGWRGKKGLRIITCAEALSKELASGLLSRCDKVWNCYGPTETTVWSTMKRVTLADLPGDGYIPIGSAVDNTRLYVLNKKLVPMPVGLAGELYIGGVGLSPGYINLPENTIKQFIPDLFSNEPGRLLYKTGDLVRFLPDGSVSFLNRIDSQVKIRGFRIELGEIESVLSRFEGVAENVVIVRQDSTGEKMLAAYYVPQDGAAPDIQEMRRYLKELLPDYMIPGAFVRMEKFPLTATNKVDRKSLPDPEVASQVQLKEYVAPVTPTEKKLAIIWASILKHSKVGIHDNFFEIGGHSMIAVSLILKIEKELGVRLPLATLFENSTVHLLGEIIDKRSKPVSWRSLVPIRPEGSRKPIFLVHGVGLNVLLYSALVNHLDPDLPVYGLQAKGLDGKEKPLETIEEIATHYISEMMTVDPDGPYAVAGFSLGGRIAFEMAQQLTAMGKKVSFLGLFDAAANEDYTSLSLLGKLGSRMQQSVKYLAWNIRYFIKDQEQTKLSIISRKLKNIRKKLRGLDMEIDAKELVSKGAESELPRYLKRVHRANVKADKKYLQKPYGGKIVLFKAKHQTFYHRDPDHYGWDDYALGGLQVHVIPGEHSRIFAPPNDRYFAAVLEESLKPSV